MMAYANTSTVNANPVAVGPGPYMVSGANDTAVCIFTPTGMDLDTNGVPNTVTYDAARTSTTCFIKGFSEKIKIQTSTGRPWFWRRIVIRSKNPTFLFYSGQDTIVPAVGSPVSPGVLENTNGMQRLWNNLSTSGGNQTISNIYNVLFRGTINLDWTDVMTAPVDTTRVDLVRNTVRTIKSGNESGTVREYNMYHPYNHNLVYDDDEAGASKTTRFYSVSDKRGQGDMHIIDLFSCGLGKGASDLLNLTSTSTVYWHER